MIEKKARSELTEHYEGGCVKYLCDCHNFLDTLRK